LKIAVLTTDTLHHAYFVREIARAYGDVVAFCETHTLAPPPFETHHPFEVARELHEAVHWFEGVRRHVSDFVPAQSFASMNDPEALTALRAQNPDFVVVFGTGLLHAPLCEAFQGRVFNLHGGDPQEYRGLDSHLWGIYHRDFTGLATCLHRLDPGLDSGDIVAQGSLVLSPGMKLHELRAINSELCVTLTLGAIDAARRGAVAAQPQRRAGRYYSAMPTVLKALCVTRFENHTARLT
jgi:folate-dependent phosphoribosylglycinamide formyltransferase PurN